MLFALSVDCENMGLGIWWKGQPPNLAADLEDEEFVGSCVLNDQLSIECHGCPFCLPCTAHKLSCIENLTFYS